MKHLLLAGILALGPLALQAQTIEITAQQESMLGIRSEVVQATDISWSSIHPANVQVPNDQLRVVSTAIPGLLEHLAVAEGVTVSKGDVLAELMSPALLELQRNYLDAMTDLNLARAEMRRDRDLVKEGIISQRRFIETESQYIRAKTQVEQTRQLIALAGLDDTEIETLVKERKLTSRLKIRAPLDGVILEQMAVAGQRLEALDPIYRLGHLDPLWLEIHVPIDEAYGIQTGTRIRVKEPDITGRVVTVGRMIHGEDQGVMVRAEISEQTEQLRPGQFVQVRLAISGSAQQFRVTRASLIRDQGKTWVFVKTDGGFEAREVQIVTEEARHLVISGELAEGDRIAVSGTATLKAAWQEGGE